MKKGAIDPKHAAARDQRAADAAEAELAAVYAEKENEAFNEETGLPSWLEVRLLACFATHSPLPELPLRQSLRQSAYNVFTVSCFDVVGRLMFCGVTPSMVRILWEGGANLDFESIHDDTPLLMTAHGNFAAFSCTRSQTGERLR